MEDSRIVDLYWRRSGDAVTETSAKYGNYCYAIAHNLLANAQDAEECVNDTWLGAWNAMPVHRPERLGPFLGKITRSLACNRYNAAQAEKRGGGELPLVLEELGDCVPASPSAAQAAEGRELAETCAQVSEAEETESALFRTAVVSVKHRISTEDSYNYLTMELDYTGGQWLLRQAGIEK